MTSRGCLAQPKPVGARPQQTRSTYLSTPTTNTHCLSNWRQTVPRTFTQSPHSHTLCVTLRSKKWRGRTPAAARARFFDRSAVANRHQSISFHNINAQTRADKPISSSEDWVAIFCPGKQPHGRTGGRVGASIRPAGGRAVGRLASGGA